MVINMLSDAILKHQEFYALYVDFSSAFNTIYHHRLWQSISMLDFDKTCIVAVQSIYKDCGIRAQVAGSETERIRIGRGTLQGDSLSPLLFITAIEPDGQMAALRRSRVCSGQLQNSPQSSMQCIC